MTDVPCLPKEKDNSKERIAKYHHFKFANCLGELIIAVRALDRKKSWITFPAQMKALTHFFLTRIIRQFLKYILGDINRMFSSRIIADTPTHTEENKLSITKNL